MMAVFDETRAIQNRAIRRRCRVQKTLNRVTNWLLIVPALVAPEANARGDLIIASKEKSHYRIVISATAIPAERYAAQELQHYLEEISGAKLPIITDAE